MTPSSSRIIIYQPPTGLSAVTLAQAGNIKIDVHLKNIYEEGELDEKATCKNYLQVQKKVAP